MGAAREVSQLVMYVTLGKPCYLHYIVLLLPQALPFANPSLNSLLANICKYLLH